MTHPFERYRSIVDDWGAFIAATERPLPTCLWTNTLRTTPAQLSKWMEGEGYSLQPIPWLPGAFRYDGPDTPGTTLAYRTGHYHLQEEVSLLPPLLLRALPGERILDLCAAPGNKTVQMAVGMHNRGTLVANDRSDGRLHVLRRSAARLGILNVTTTCMDAARYPMRAGHFDGVLADVPCSCEGTVRKHPRVLSTAGKEQSCRLAHLQAQILQRAAARCRPGGRIVYSTCTFAPEENECVLHELLGSAEGESLSVVPIDGAGLRGAPGLTDWEGRALHPLLSNALRIWPHMNDTGGFFVALLQKAT